MQIGIHIMVHKNKCMAVIVMLILLAILLYEIDLHRKIQLAHKEYQSIESYMREVVYSSVVEVYNTTGVLYTNYASYKSSSFYRGMGNGIGISGSNEVERPKEIDFMVTEANQYVFTGSWRNKNVESNVLIESFPKYPKEEQSRKLMKFVLLGSESITKYVESTSNNVELQSDAMDGGIDKGNSTLALPKAINTITFDLPSSNKEIAEYIFWLNNEVIGKSMTDAWGQYIVLSITDDRLLCRSPSVDGILGTKDDIIEAVRIDRDVNN